MSEKLITVFTPSYNRAYRIGDLYNSLLRQTSHNFLWHIIDDGSTDNTEELVRSMIDEQKIHILYERQKNSGKHAAHNRAAKECTTELFMCVDSDDYLTVDAIELISTVWAGVDEQHKKKLSGIVANRGDKAGNVIGTEFPAGISEDGLSQLYKKGKKGDTAIAFRTEVIQQYPFPVFEDERFLREHIIYDEIDKTYKLLVLNKIVYVCEYLEDGLSRNATQIELKNPRGAALARLHDAKKHNSILIKLRNLSAYVLFCCIANDLKTACAEIGALKVCLLAPLAFAGYLRYKFKRLF